MRHAMICKLYIPQTMGWYGQVFSTDLWN